MYLHEMNGRMLRDIVEIVLNNEDTGENLERALNSLLRDVLGCIGLNGWVYAKNRLWLEKNDHVFSIYWCENAGGYHLEVDMLTTYGNLSSDNLMHLVDVANSLVEIEY